MRFALYTIGLLVGGLVIAAMLVDEGELATLESVSPDGRHWETQVWLVELDGVPHLRAHSTDTEWLERVRRHPELKLVREKGEKESDAWQAEINGSDPDLRARVNRAMAEKYGTADRILTWFYDPEAMVPVRLVPAAGS